MARDHDPPDIEKALGRQSTGCTSAPSSDSAPTSPWSTSSFTRLWRQSKLASGNGNGSGHQPKLSWLSNFRVGRQVTSDDGVEDDEDDRQPVVRRLQDCPDGYPRLAAFLDSDDNFMIYRRFGYLQSRLLLEKQEHLRQLEEELENLDEEDREAESRNLITMENYDTEQYKQRRELMQRIGCQFREYASLLQAAQALTHCNRPSFSEYKSVENFINNRHPLYPSEEGFIYRKEDLVILRPGREHAWVDCWVEKFLRFSRCRMIQDLFRSKETKQKTDGIENYYTRDRIDRFVIAIIVFMILTLLIVPIYLLYHLTKGAGSSRSHATCIGVLLIFTLSFSACLSLFTRAKRHEILAAAAAYCAVLVVFLGNLGGSGVGVRF